MRRPREGDTLKETRLDRISRSFVHLGAELKEQGIGLHIIEQTSTPSTTGQRE